MSHAIHRAPDRRRYRDGARAALPLGVADLAFGTWFGVLAHTAGIGNLAAVIMSATTFAGSAQFAAASVLGAGGSVVAAVTAAVMLNLRYGPIGLSAAPALPRPGWRTALTAQLVVDESWAIAQREPGRFDHHLLIGAGLTLYASWVAGTAVGMLASGLVADPERLGLDAAAPALFLALLAPQLGSRSRRLAAAGGTAVALALQPVAPAGVPVIAASLACLAGLVRRQRG
jgi:4-azaleucine resistance transporter AzlC